ncbi:MAG: hypothetical protein OIF50_10775, partial [Flavobacteriaceae bacterium]|nr:hypothetical protein [Flavobacteriaceae bacterium]
MKREWEGETEYTKPMNMREVKLHFYKFMQHKIIKSEVLSNDLLNFAVCCIHKKLQLDSNSSDICQSQH